MCPFVGIEQAQQQLDGGGLAGTIRAEQAEHFAAPHLEIHVVHRARLGPAPEILEDLGQPADGDDDFAVGLSGCRGLRVRFANSAADHEARHRLTPSSAPARPWPPAGGRRRLGRRRFRLIMLQFLAFAHEAGAVEDHDERADGVQHRGHDRAARSPSAASVMPADDEQARRTGSSG